MSQAQDVKVQIEYVGLGAIKPYWNNPRINDGAVEDLKKSIQEFNFLVPIVVDADGIIVTGHTRYKASVELNLGEVPIIRANHLTPAQINAFRIADNRLSENAKWDENKLSEELRGLAGMGFDLGFTGFSKEELDCLCGMITADCLQDLSYQNVCGDVAPIPLKEGEAIGITIGGYRTKVNLKVYKAWEADKLKEFPKLPQLVNHIHQLLGFDKYAHLLVEEKAEEGTPPADTQAEPAAEPAAEPVDTSAANEVSNSTEAAQ